jgi:hypothetical protein
LINVLSFPVWKSAGCGSSRLGLLEHDERHVIVLWPFLSPCIAGREQTPDNRMGRVMGDFPE